MTDQIEQGSPEWIAIRVGKATASRISDVVARTKSGWGASRSNYMAELIAERLTGVPAEHYTNGAMARGIEMEPFAIDAYEMMAQQPVERVGFVPHPTIAMSGASPDGLVGADGLVEVKCPNTATHIDTLLTHAVPGKYVTQMMWQLACTGRAWCEFVSFDNRLPDELQLFVHRVWRDDKMIASLEKDVVDFLDEVERKLADLMERESRRAKPDTPMIMAG